MSSSTPASSRGDRYFDVTVEYAKAAPDDILMRVTITNQAPEGREASRSAAAFHAQYLVVGGG